MTENLYAFTVKDNTKDKFPLIADYQAWIAHAESKGVKIEDHYYELDSRGRLHVHGVLRGAKNLYKKRLMYEGMHQKIDLLPDHFDLECWLRYIRKGYVDNATYQDFLLDYEINHNPELMIDYDTWRQSLPDWREGL